MLSANSWRSWNGLKIDFSFAWRSANHFSFTNMKWERDKDKDSKKKSVFHSWDGLQMFSPPSSPYYPYPFHSHLIHQIHILMNASIFITNSQRLGYYHLKTQQIQPFPKHHLFTRMASWTFLSPLELSKRRIALANIFPFTSTFPNLALGDSNH